MTETCSQECAKKKIKGVLSLFEKSNKVLKKELRLLKGVLTCAHSEEIFLTAPIRYSIWDQHWFHFYTKLECRIKTRSVGAPLTVKSLIVLSQFPFPQYKILENTRINT